MRDLVLIGLELLMLQIELHLVDLQLVQQFERVAGSVGIAGQAVEQRQGVLAD
jgi:hypothetical protein